MTVLPEAPKLYRDPTNRVLAGVAAGLSAHLGTPKLVIRLVFVVLAGYHGMGALLYAAFWALVPRRPDVPGTQRNIGQLVAFIALGLGVFLALDQVTGTASGLRGYVGWLIAAVAVGAGIIWHHTDPKQRARWSETMPQTPWLAVVTDRGRTAYLSRFIGGGLLIVGGIIGVVAVFAPLDDAGVSSVLYGLLFAAVALAGVGLALAPVLWRMFSQLTAEREARVREQERAEVAAMIHDQVLHTLALILRNSGDVKMVQRLARGQERTLRNWLYRSTASPTERLSAGLEEAAAEVEDTYAITVETVMVGDARVDDSIAALLAAVREALVNAARHAQVASVSVYAEVETDTIMVYVRDRGVGFDQTTIDDHRHGVRGSIIGRMERHGGRAVIRSAPGEGTEVRLSMPIGAQARWRDEEGT